MSACRDCKNCTNSGIAHASRKFGRMSAGLYYDPRHERTRHVRHEEVPGMRAPDELHGTDQVGGAVQPTVQVQTRVLPGTAGGSSGLVLPGRPENPPV